MTKVLPYTHFDGMPTFRDSEIEALFALMVRDNTVETVFYDQSIKTGSDFIRFVKSPGVVLFVAQDEFKPVGCGWVNGFECQTARAHFCLFSEVWGNNSVSVGKKLVQTAIATLRLKMLIGYIPSYNVTAIKFGQKCGAKIATELPHGGIDKSGKSCPITILYYVR